MYRIPRTSGFTLAEIMIVLAMIGILFSISLFPYQYYMDRYRVEKNMDMISQEWILAHSDIKNGFLYAPDRHATGYFEFTRGASQIKLYLLSGSDLSTKKLYKVLPFEGDVQIQGFTPNVLWDATTLGYLIFPPYATGSFLTGSTSFSRTGILLRIGYPGATIETKRARDILLRPYYPTF